MPAASCSLALPLFQYDANADLSLERPLLLDVYEVTRGDVEQYYGRAATDADPADPAWSTERPLLHVAKSEWPASLDFHRAQELAARRGMRLPTAREWLHVAVGRRAQPFPWGPRDQSSVANTLELGLESPSPVGTFESGRSRPFGCYDLVGNVWEWVSDTVPGALDASTDFRRSPIDFHRNSDRLRDDPGQVSVLGGAYDTARQPTFRWQRLGDQLMLVFHARRAHRDTRSPTIGARMCADAERYLWEQGGRWGGGEEARRRVVAVGRRWASDPTARSGLQALLEELRARPGAPEALGWLAEGAREAEAPAAP